MAGAVSISGNNITTSGSVRAITDPQEFQKRITQDAFPPVMSYFEPQKTTTSGVNFITSQRQRYKDLVDGAETLVIVGMRVRPHDQHIWGPLSSTGGRIVYCSGKTGGMEYSTWAKKERPSKDNLVLNGYFKDEFMTIATELDL